MELSVPFVTSQMANFTVLTISVHIFRKKKNWRKQQSKESNFLISREFIVWPEMHTVRKLLFKYVVRAWMFQSEPQGLKTKNDNLCCFNLVAQRA